MGLFDHIYREKEPSLIASPSANNQNASSAIPAIPAIFDTYGSENSKNSKNSSHPIPVAANGAVTQRQPANGNEDVAASIKSSRSRNNDAEKRHLTDRWCLCGSLAQNEWQTPRGRLWICEPCRDSGLLDMLQGKNPTSEDEG